MIYRFGRYTLDPERFELRAGDVPVPLEPQVFELLHYLVVNRHRVVQKTEVLEAVWPGRFVSESALTSRVKAARKAVGDNGSAQNLIRTIHGRGFRFIADVEEQSSDQRQSSSGEARSGEIEVAAQPHAPESTPPSIAVLPFSDYSAERDQGYFCEGIADEILNTLAKIPELRVASRTSSRFREGVADIRTIGAELGVTTVLEGSVRKAGKRIRVIGQLIDVRTGFHLWSERYDRELEDIFAIQDEIAESIAAALKVTLDLSGVRGARGRSPEHIEAYEYYLRGRQILYQFRPVSWEAAEAMFRRAIEVDPHYARAWAGLADACITSYMYLGEGEDVLRRADQASKKAVELDPGLAEAHSARGLVLTLRDDFGEAEHEFREALRLDPKSFAVSYFYGRGCMASGRWEEAIEHFRRAAAIDSDRFDVWGLMSGLLGALGRTDEQQKAMDEHVVAAKRHLALYPADVRATYSLALNYARCGKEKDAMQLASRALELGTGEPPVHYNVCCVYAVLGKKDLALGQLSLAIDCGYNSRSWIENDPDLDPLRDDPRYAAALARLSPP